MVLRGKIDAVEDFQEANLQIASELCLVENSHAGTHIVFSGSKCGDSPSEILFAGSLDSDDLFFEGEELWAILFVVWVVGHQSWCQSPDKDTTWYLYLLIQALDEAFLTVDMICFLPGGEVAIRGWIGFYFLRSWI